MFIQEKCYDRRRKGVGFQGQKRWLDEWRTLNNAIGPGAKIEFLVVGDLYGDYGPAMIFITQ
jgi:hypothetical protein